MQPDWRAIGAHSRVRLTYRQRFGRFPNLAQPRLFTEWVQWRKLNDRSAHHPALMDKLAAKCCADRHLGRAWIIPTLWSGVALPLVPPVAGRAMLKARHGCNQNAVLADPRPGIAWRQQRARARQWCARPYGGVLDEWAYRSVPRGLLIEPFVSDTGDLPIDYKIYVFGGQATHVQVHVGRGTRHRWGLFDREFRPLVPVSDRIAPPRSLRAMLDAAEALAAREDFLRVDFYEVGGKPLFGEFCLYPGSGLDRFGAPGLDRALGRLWGEAYGARVASESARGASLRTA